MNQMQNKRVQGTRHKVSGPLTRDVRTENERCGTRQSKGATATAIWI